MRAPHIPKKPPILPRGPAIVRQPVVHTGGPGKPPDGFVVGQTSASEWNLYWAFAKVFKNPPDPRRQPFMGGWPDWAYQVSALGSYTRAPGSAVVDYEIFLGRGILGVRLQTQRYHITTDAEKHAYDLLQQFNLSRYIEVVDVYEGDVLGDDSGQKYVITAKRAIGKLERINPIIAGTATKRVTL